MSQLPFHEGDVDKEVEDQRFLKLGLLLFLMSIVQQVNQVISLAVACFIVEVYLYMYDILDFS